MTMTAEMPGQVAWWREPTKDQWFAWIAAWLGWTLDAFDFTIFLLIMVPIAESFHVPLIEVTAVFTITLGCGWWAPLAPAGSPIASGARRR
jgi:MFS transporter, SHS family, lactate transporter